MIHDHTENSPKQSGHMKRMGLRLLLMAVLHFIAMYFLMYAMVDRLDNVILNLNQLYMAAIMTSPMLIIELVLMGSMYGSKKRLGIIIAGSLIVFAVAFLFMRQQTVISDKEFLRSMIPHHAGAVLMVEESSLSDTRVIALSQQIIESQQKEIEYMKELLKDLK
jgi:hypothetical protein